MGVLAFNLIKNRGKFKMVLYIRSHLEWHLDDGDATFIKNLNDEEDAFDLLEEAKFIADKATDLFPL